jgi:hypothetical protein
MQKKKTFWFPLIGSVLLTLIAAACGPTKSTGTPATLSTPPTVPAGESLYILDGYGPSANGSTGQRIVAVHPGNTNAASLLTLSAGLFSQDHQRIYTAKAQHGQTTITITNSQTGSTVRSFTIPGTYSTSTQSYGTTSFLTGGQGYDTAVLSVNGRWLALRQSEQTGDSTFAVIDTQDGKLIKLVRLDRASYQSDFYLDAISPDGAMLYLLQYLSQQPGRYYVRAYNVQTNQLIDNIIADKSELNDPRMVGSAVARQMSKDGWFAYTLYADAGRNIAFVHVLPMNSSDPNNPPYFARCIELPVGKSGNLLRYYTLVLSDDGTTLYAVNAALGVVSTINLSAVIFNDNIHDTVDFNIGNVSLTNDDKTRMMHNGAVLSSDQKTLYVAGVRGIWALDALTFAVRRHYATSQAFTGVAMSADDKTLYGVYPASGITLVNVTSGQTQQLAQSPAHTPWGIEWITN